ncbi:LpqN/LpqT family lipoprotein [Mycolicibacterium sp. 050232]|uniref:LpqN/LpqT family lipoprotein n=1 Tax=Mycolicibacterium sp. 050232 TaxID=3113982 RepID=UPI002E2A4765|nr:LpqN/LpqT family lipoprotein [Mycolicibacterium sp. 050232]MED5813785.1 LpqN/LpqT family lipoprotein [Mycolicibacterium sp. 050232]
MTTSMRAGGIVIAAVALGVMLTGCGGKTVPGTATEASGNNQTSTEPTTTKAGETSAPAAGHQYTIRDYIRDNKITETAVRRGDPGTPTLEMPIPEGWSDAGASTPEWAWGAIVSTDPQFAADPPSIIALMAKLTGDVDPAKILEYAPNEIRNMPGYENQGDGSADELSGFEAYQIGGTYVKDGAPRLIAQKTVVIPGADGLFVLQFNADGTEDQMGPLMDATAVIDEQTVITP